MKPVVLLCLLLCAAAVADTSYVVVGTPDRLNAVPFWGLTYDAFRCQWLYYAADIGRSGRIVSVGVWGAPDAPATFHNVRYLFCHTNVTQLSSQFADNYAGNTPTEVFAADTLVVGDGPPADWFTVPADFEYDNAKNLIVEIRWRGDEGLTANLYRRNVTHDYRRCIAYDDTAPSGFADTVPGNHIRFGFVTTSLAEPVQYVVPAAPSPAASVVRNVFNLPVSSLASPLQEQCGFRNSAFLLDACGRRVLDLAPGPNDVSRLAPGVYFICPSSPADGRKPPAVSRLLLVR